MYLNPPWSRRNKFNPKQQWQVAWNEVLLVSNHHVQTHNFKRRTNFNHLLIQKLQTWNKEDYESHSSKQTCRSDDRDSPLKNRVPLDEKSVYPRIILWCSGPEISYPWKGMVVLATATYLISCIGSYTAPRSFLFMSSHSWDGYYLNFMYCFLNSLVYAPYSR